MKSTPSGHADSLIAAIEDAEWLDHPAFVIANGAAMPQRLAGRPGRRIQNALQGTWFGHPVHPAVVTIPIGTWTLAAGLDALEASGLATDPVVGRSADLALKVGIAGAVAAAATGLSDWHQTHGRSRRVGLAHAAVQSTALACQVASVVLRGRGQKRKGQFATLVGWGLMFAGAYLGGHLVYRLRQGVDQADRSVVPRDFEPILPLTELEEDRPRRVEVWDQDERALIPVVLVRHRGRISAMGARCSHMGGPLDEGWILDGALVCPWHGSRYHLATGRPLDGPSTCPQPCWMVGLRDGMIELKRKQDPGASAVTYEDVLAAEETPSVEEATGPLGRKADEVLFEHHELLRSLFRRIEAMDPEDPRRRDLLRILASELDIHEHIEDAIFYPAVRPVSEDVSEAYAEHQVLADLLATTLKLSTSSPAFDEHIRALHAAVDHHASSEETSMFLEAQRLGERRLRELGCQLETMMEHERTSRFQSAFRELKLELLSNVGSAGGGRRG